MKAWFGCAVVASTMTALFACKGDVMTVGENDAAVADEAYPQEWSGYVEAKRFPSGSDRVMLTLTSPTTGTLFLGEGPPLEKATDPNAGYLVDLLPLTARGSRGLERFPFTLRNVAREGDRITFTIQPTEPWAEWCGMQTPTEERGLYLCVPNRGHEYANLPDGGQECLALTDEAGAEIDGGIPVSCGRLETCNMCVCSANGCRNRDIPTRELSPLFDFRVVEGRIEGTSAYGLVRLTRKEVAR